jgi:hypothetical protein
VSVFVEVEGDDQVKGFPRRMTVNDTFNFNVFVFEVQKFLKTSKSIRFFYRNEKDHCIELLDVNKTLKVIFFILKER